MIYRFLSHFLVALMLANQGLCLAHAHHGTDIDEPEGHATRPHFHIGGHVYHDATRHHDHHTDHSHGDRSNYESDERDDARPLDVSPVGEHDSDALYCGESVTLARDGNSVTVLAERDVSMAAFHHIATQDDGLLRLGPLPGQPPSVLGTACPIYLRTLSLRL